MCFLMGWINSTAATFWEVGGNLSPAHQNHASILSCTDIHHGPSEFPPSMLYISTLFLEEKTKPTKRSLTGFEQLIAGGVPASYLQ